MPGKKTPGPSVKDKKLYEDLRDEGNSKEKSARIANAAGHLPQGRGPQGREVRRLRRLDGGPPAQAGREIGIEGRSRMNKAELVKALRDH